MQQLSGISARVDLRFSAQAASSLAILGAACLILLNALVHASVYGIRNYREDEVVIVHSSKLSSPSEIARYAMSDSHPPGWLLLADAWADSFGLTEEITRWLSKLTNLMTFALLYQLGKHIAGKRAGLYAVVLLGVYGFASSSMHELRPYPMLIMLATALHLLFYRWIHKPSSPLMFAYVCTGIAAIYTHFFSFFIFPAHAMFLLLFTRFERKFWLNSFLMWVFIGLSFLGWLLPFLQAIVVVLPGGIYYSIPPGWEGIRYYYDISKFRPEIVFQLLFLLSLFYPWMLRTSRPDAHRFRFQRRYITMYPLVLLVLTISIAYAGDSLVRSFSLRNVVMFAPLIALSMALGLRLLPNIAALLMLALLILHAPGNTNTQTSNAPYREIIQEMSPGYLTDSLVITEFSWAWRWLLPAAYYLMDFTPDKMSKDRIHHLVQAGDHAHPPNYPDELVNIHKVFEPGSFNSLLPMHKQLWHLQEGGGNALGAEFGSWLNLHYARLRTVSWNEEYETTYSLSEYARAPANEGPILDVGDSLRLYAWEYQSNWDASPCQAVTIESWWQMRASDATPYTISLILADAGGDSQLAIANSVPADQFTSDWAPNRYYRDRTTIDIPCEIRSGSYDLLLAAKESLSGKPLGLAYPSGDALGREYYLTTLNVAQR